MGIRLCMSLFTFMSSLPCLNIFDMMPVVPYKCLVFVLYLVLSFGVIINKSKPVVQCMFFCLTQAFFFLNFASQLLKKLNGNVMLVCSSCVCLPRYSMTHNKGASPNYFSKITSL